MDADFAEALDAELVVALDAVHPDVMLDAEVIITLDAVRPQPVASLLLPAPVAPLLLPAPMAVSQPWVPQEGWRIHASTLEDDVTFEIKIHVENHDYCSTRKSEKMKSASKSWICDKVTDWLREDPSRGTKELQGKLKDKYKVLIPYKRVWIGRELALNNLFGDWDDSFDKLYSWKAEVEKRSPGSIVSIDHMTFKETKRFTRLFVALKPCVDGFLAGCMPYLAIDSTHLTGKYRGQLATACAVDGHSWLYPVVFGVIDSKTSENWVWFMEN
ncbi:uncharacterized protein LOC133925950 [Phragmites australis]|uniref:uncharacterized protein LOC133925950 n=1 Tax=Phragmites australis TaxID=29695 RepID=UPI002D7702D7|nr:uncharacterized protein LOC133925950 [Phragmites australis]